MRLARFDLLAMIAAVGWALTPPPAIGESASEGPSRLTLRLQRGICIDRQVRTMPAEAGMRIQADDIRLIRQMGFESVKLLVNPAVILSQDGMNASAQRHFDAIINLAAGERLPVVVCIHPEDDFKRAALGQAERFESLLKLMQALSRHLARHWTSRQVALQLMTEPYGSSDDPAAWNHWNRLQKRLWESARREMPAHTLILSGDHFGSLEGLEHIQPVDDDNVMYCFTFRFLVYGSACRQETSGRPDRTLFATPGRRS